MNIFRKKEKINYKITKNYAKNIILNIKIKKIILIKSKKKKKKINVKKYLLRF